MVDAMALEPTPPSLQELYEQMTPDELGQAQMFAMMVDQMPDDALDFLIRVLQAKRAERGDDGGD